MTMSFEFLPHGRKHSEVGLYFWRFQQEGINLLDPNTLSTLTLEECRSIFRADNRDVEIPLLEARLQIMHEHATILMNDFDGCFTTCIKVCASSAVKLLHLVCDKFPSFRDRAIYKERHGMLNFALSELLRAQILIADLWLAFKGKSYGHFSDIDALTAFADYRVPQVLAYFGVLHYDDDLMLKLKKRSSGSVWEVEIRGVCLQAVEKTQELLSREGDRQTICNSVTADNFLWLYRRQFAKEVEAAMPMHRTRCIYY
ncbi:unnamed protein product [Hydatigera taeniaeformis]|uniref:Queuosine 5'-phosphate N-glycosylase/hydrolase n=1 Tax=Hydatigena taeniaeformis TaxID=6205 RepID=A0A0R3WMZ1_HYDTA|nr:unnamed protein product [Hydatigera taeniaeformis]